MHCLSPNQGPTPRTGLKYLQLDLKKKKNSCIVGVSLNKEKIKTKCKGMLITVYSKNPTHEICNKISVKSRFELIIFVSILY
jgi:hypothetical protein